MSTTDDLPVEMPPKMARQSRDQSEGGSKKPRGRSSTARSPSGGRKRSLSRSPSRSPGRSPSRSPDRSSEQTSRSRARKTKRIRPTQTKGVPSKAPFTTTVPQKSILKEPRAFENSQERIKVQFARGTKTRSSHKTLN